MHERYRRVVLATDGSEDAKRAAGFLAALDWPAGTALTVVGVCEATVPAASTALPDTGVAQDARRYLALVQQEVRQRTQRFVADAAAIVRERQPDVAIVELVRTGEPADELLAQLREDAADLAVAGARGHSVVHNLLLGSVSEALVTEAPCPVVIVRERSWPETGGTVLVAIGPHDGAHRLAEAVLRLPLPGGTRVVVSAVEAGPARDATDGSPTGPAGAAADDLAARLRSAEPGWSVETRVLAGDVAEELMRAAADLAADLIVVGARERGGLIGRLGLGNVSRKLVRRAACSVLVVRAAEGSDGSGDGA